MSPISLPKPSEQAKAAFQKLVPADPAVTMRPMFGNLSAFVNGNMFSGLFGDDLFVRVSEEDQAKIRKQGGKPFEVMPGRAMTGYVMLPAGWQKKPDAARTWVGTALSWSRALPPKAAKGKKPTLRPSPKARAKISANRAK
jgi:TfoX/Sxy family transcriptional regulator of competence genes